MKLKHLPLLVFQVSLWLLMFCYYHYDQTKSNSMRAAVMTEMLSLEGIPYQQ